MFFLKFTTEQMSEGEANKWNLSPGPDHFLKVGIWNLR